MTRRALTLIEVVLATALAAMVVASAASVLRLLPSPEPITDVSRSSTLEDAVDAFLESADLLWWRDLDADRVVSLTAPDGRSLHATAHLQPASGGGVWCVLESEGAASLRWLPSEQEAP